MSLRTRFNRIRRIIRATWVRKFIHFTRRIIIPGFEGISLWEILFFFMWSIRRGLLTTRAAALSFHFFLALIPFGLILVIISAQLPFFDLQHEIAPILSNFIPDELIFNFLKNMKNYENSSVTSLISFGFVIALYFTSNGFAMLIRSFNHSTRAMMKGRKWWSVKLVALGYVVVFTIGFVGLFFLILSARKMLNHWSEQSQFIGDHHNGIFGIVSFLFIAIFIYFGVALIYYFAPTDRKGFRFFSAGATLATILAILISIGYSYYVTAFARYGDLYGSLGTIMILLLWIYLNSLALLIGFELNASIQGAIRHKRLDAIGKLEARYKKNY